MPTENNEIYDQCRGKGKAVFKVDDCLCIKKKCPVEALHKHYSNQYGWDFCPRCGRNVGGLENGM